jgi:large subunit ribosomal protein L4
MEIAVYNQDGKKTGTVELPDSVFGLRWNADLVHQVVTAQEANQRQTVAHVKGRSEVRGGGKKPWRQKGTGRARHGSIRSPLWKGGGVTHGPTKEKNFKKKINKKMAKKALYTVLSAKARDNEIIVLDEIKLSMPKTKIAYEVFNKLSQINDYKDLVLKNNGVLIALAENNQLLKRAMSNLPFVGLEEARNLNALEVLKYKYLLLPKEAIEKLKK